MASEALRSERNERNRAGGHFFEVLMGRKVNVAARWINRHSGGRNRRTEFILADCTTRYPKSMRYNLKPGASKTALAAGHLSYSVKKFL